MIDLDYETRYHRLLADVRAARDMIGDSPGRMAGHTAVTVLDKTLKRHRLTRPDRVWCPGCARHVPESHMRQHEGGGRYVELDECKSCKMTRRG